MDIEELFNSIDLSDLSLEGQLAFKDWLKEKSDLQITLRNALRRGQSLKVVLGKRSVRSVTEYQIQIR